VKRLLPHLLWIGGLVLLFVAAHVGPGVPYQDPTPEMRALELKQMQSFDRFALAGLITLACGVIWLISAWMRRTKQMHRTSR
jgi:hypothetical protein